jgi:acyl-CoA hydrolase
MAVGHINFRKSVEVGGIALFNSQVCYSADRFMQVSVEAQVLDVETQKSEVCFFEGFLILSIFHLIAKN